MNEKYIEDSKSKISLQSGIGASHKSPETRGCFGDPLSGDFEHPTWYLNPVRRKVSYVGKSRLLKNQAHCSSSISKDQRK